MKKFYLFVVTTFSSILCAHAQVTAPDSVVVELTGPSTSAYQLPARMVIKTFGAASSTFTGSNNKPETGSPYYSQSVEAGATFFPITGQQAGFPPRKSTSSPQPNRTGGSSFLAMKSDGNGNWKYWLNVSVGGYLNNGTQIFQWEYHFRYFYNSLTGEERGTLGSVPNSGEYIPGAVDFLVSLGNQKCKPFSGVIKDSYANLITGNLAQDPLPNATITLKEGSQVIKSVITDAAGAYTFSTDSLSKDKLYKLDISFQSDTVPLKVLIDNVKVCNAAPSIVVPNREMKAVLAELKGLTGLHIDASVFGGTVADAIPITDYNLSAIKQEIGKWKEIDKEYEKTIETMNRTYLSLYLLKDYYNKSNVFSGKLLRLFYEVGSGVVSMVNSAKTIQKLVGDEALKIDKKLLAGASGVELLQLKKDLIVLKVIDDLIKKVQKSILDGYQKGLVEAALAQFGDSDEDKIAKACIYALSNALEKALYGGGNFAEDLMKEIAFNVGTKLVVDKYYIGSTQEFVDKISPKIASLSYSDSWTSTANTVRPLIAASEQSNAEALNAGEAFESAAGQFGTVSGFVENIAKVAAVTVIGAPIAAPLYTISKFVKGFSLASNSAALFLYSKRYFTHTSELEAGLAKTFAPFGGNILREDYPSISYRLNADPVSGEEFEDSLVLYRNNIDTYYLLREAELVGHIDSLGTILDKAVNERLTQVHAALSGNQANTALVKVYKELTLTYSDYNSRYLTVQLQTISHLLDTADVEITNSLKLEIDTLVTITTPLVKILSKVDSILPLVSNPYQFVKVSEVVAPDTIWHDSNFEVTVKYKNYGNFRALPFGITLTPSDDLVIPSDSVSASALQAGQEASIKIQLSAGDIKPNPTFLVTFYNVTSAPETILLPFYSKIIKRGDIVSSIDDEAVNTSRSEIKVFPNPANEDLYVVSSTSLGQAKVNIYDTKGSLQLSQAISGTQAQLSTATLSSGLYILTIQDMAGQVIKREKIVIANSK